MSGPGSRGTLDRLGAVLYTGQSRHLQPFAVAGRRPGRVVADDGTEYLDLAASRGTNPFGAPPEPVLAAATAALADFGNEDVHHLTNPIVTTLAARVIEATPPSLTRVDMALSGTEAVEIALRLMRRATGRPLVLGFHRQYHGETAAAVGLGAAGDSSGMRHMTPGFVHAPHPYRTPFETAGDGTGDATVDYIRRHLLFHAVHPGDVAGLVVQPFTAEAIDPPPSFWGPVVELARDHGWMLCVDETPWGLARTGTVFGVEAVGVAPDLLCLGESLAGGTVPIGAILGSEAVMGSFDDTETGSTWSWLPAACAAAVAALDEIDRQGVLDHVATLGQVAGEALAGLTGRDGVVDVRIHAALAGVELSQPDVASTVARACLAQGVLVSSRGPTVVMAPAFDLTADQYRDGLRTVVGAVEAAVRAR